MYMCIRRLIPADCALRCHHNRSRAPYASQSTLFVSVVYYGVPYQLDFNLNTIYLAHSHLLILPLSISHRKIFVGMGAFRLELDGITCIIYCCSVTQSKWKMEDASAKYIIN